MSSPFVAPPVVKTQTLACPNCGGPVELRGFGHALTAVCKQCLSVLDASTPELTVLEKIQESQRRTPLIPLGTRGTLAGAPWEVIGFQTRSTEDGSWDEYLLFNPYKGFRYLTEWEGHWNFVTPLESMPVRIAMRLRPAVTMDGHIFKHFSGAEAATTFVLGEFPWRVKVGETVVADDFVDPPLVLSSESTENEVTWSRGVYTPGAEIWKAFQLPDKAPAAKGVYLNQPSPYAGHVGSVWNYFLGLVAILAGLAFMFSTFGGQREAFRSSYSFSPGGSAEPSFVTPVFDLKDRTAAVEVNISTNLTNNWAYFNFALINEDSGEAFDFGKEVSYYYGSDSDGSWSEGGRTASVLVPSVPPGRYYLRVEPEMDTPPAATDMAMRRTMPPAMRYSLTLTHGVLNYSWFWLAAVFLLIPPLFHTIRARSFETKRWMDSDYPPIRTGGGD
jgi:Domain of unknown function (DUF4178)